MKYVKTAALFLAGIGIAAVMMVASCDQLSVPSAKTGGDKPCIHNGGKPCPHKHIRPCEENEPEPCPQQENAGNSGRPDFVAANLWMATSAEYEAVCIQTFRLARDKIEERAQKLGHEVDGKSLAIIMDLDETVMDNSLFWSWLAKTGTPYSDELWSQWEIKHAEDVSYVPGAKFFIEEIRGLGVDIAFVSNRFEQNREHTVRAMIQMGLIDSADEVTGDNWWKLQLAGTSSSKEERRQNVRDRRYVIAYLGDTMGDFSADFDKHRDNTVRGRRAALHKNRQHLGKDWFVLPNPVYGHWERAINMDQPRRSLPVDDKMDDMAPEDPAK